MKTNVTVVASYKLDNETLKVLEPIAKARLGLPSVEFTSTIDKSIVGGVKLVYGDMVLDYTIDNLLERLSKDLQES